MPAMERRSTVHWHKPTRRSSWKCWTVCKLQELHTCVARPVLQGKRVRSGQQTLLVHMYCPPGQTAQGWLHLSLSLHMQQLSTVFSLPGTPQEYPFAARLEQYKPKAHPSSIYFPDSARSPLGKLSISRALIRCCSRTRIIGLSLTLNDG